MTDTITETIDALWAAFDEHPDDLSRLGIIADAYRDAGSDQFADCLEWCRDNKRKPRHYDFGSKTTGEWGWVIKDYSYMILDQSSVPTAIFALDLEPATEDGYQHILHNQPTRSAAYRHLCQFWIGS